MVEKNNANNNDTINLLFKCNYELNKFVELFRLQNDLTKEEALNEIIKRFRASKSGQEIMEKSIR